jgi:peptidoglycan LD-endopeptidase LytH
MRITKRKKFLLLILILFGIGFLIPQKFIIPVEGAKKGDWNEQTFWYPNWGKSGVHKGVDVFAEKGKNVVSSTCALVLYKGKMGRGGNVILSLGPKWRVHYYAHLQSIDVGFLSILKRGQTIGKVGKTGNAATTPPHLHYAIISLVPYPWRIDKAAQGWKKMFFLNPIPYFNQ